MSAKFNIQDKHWLFASPKKDTPLQPVEKEVLFHTFDTETYYDITKIEEQIKEEKSYKKLCLIEILLTPVELPLFFLFFGTTYLKTKIASFKLSWKLLFNYIKFDTFKKELIELRKNGIIT